MPMPVKSLPVMQNWDCHSCGECCRSYHVRVSEVEKARIESQNWHEVPEVAGVAGVVFDKPFGSHRLNHRDDGACVFLGPENRCRIHAKFGAAAKPMACRIYPFILVPVGDHWRVSLRMACPSAVSNLGRPLADHAEDLKEYAALIEADAGGTMLQSGTQSLPAPELQTGQATTWADLQWFARSLAAQIADDSTPIDHRLRKIIAIADLCRKSRFEKVSGSRLKEFLDVISGAVAEDVPLNAKDVAEPTWLGRVVFRQMVAIYARKDAGLNPGIASKSRLIRIKAAWRFAVGRGPIPRLHGLMPQTTFEQLERPTGPLSEASRELLTRFYQVKLESLQFCGPTNFRRQFWPGLDSLILTFPAIQWLSRVFSANGERSRDDAMKLAVQVVDSNFGFNKLLGASRQTWATQTLTDRGEFAKLVAWYAR